MHNAQVFAFGACSVLVFLCSAVGQDTHYFEGPAWIPPYPIGKLARDIRDLPDGLEIARSHNKFTALPEDDVAQTAWGMQGYQLEAQPNHPGEIAAVGPSNYINANYPGLQAIATTPGLPHTPLKIPLFPGLRSGFSRKPTGAYDQQEPVASGIGVAVANNANINIPLAGTSQWGAESSLYGFSSMRYDQTPGDMTWIPHQ